MHSGHIVREISPGGGVAIRDAHCQYVLRRLRSDALEVEIVGTDRGQFGSAAIDEVTLALFREPELTLFVDASRASFSVPSVSRAWARFFDTNRRQLKRVAILASSRGMEVTMGIVRHLSDTAHLIQIYSDREAYEARKGLPAS